MIETLLDKLTELQRAVNRISSVNVNSQTLKSRVIEAGSYYFKVCRDSVEKLRPDSSLLAEYDATWQDLIKLAHGNNSRRSYKKLIAGLLGLTKDISILHSISPSSPQSISFQPSQEETQLLHTLDNSLPSAALSYSQVLLDLRQVDTRTSYRGTAAELRETLREVLDHFAPDSEVEKEQWYKPESKQTKPTLKQKVKFILKAREKNDTVRKPAEKAAELVDELYGQLARSLYDRASLSTHSVTQREEVMRIKRFVDTLLFELLEVQAKSD